MLLSNVEQVSCALHKLSGQIQQHAVHENTVKELVDLLVSSGLRDAGYTYFNLDGAKEPLFGCPAHNVNWQNFEWHADCWSLPWRSTEGKLQADPAR